MSRCVLFYILNYPQIRNIGYIHYSIHICGYNQYDIQFDAIFHTSCKTFCNIFGTSKRKRQLIKINIFIQNNVIIYPIFHQPLFIFLLTCLNISKENTRQNGSYHEYYRNTYFCLIYRSMFFSLKLLVIVIL